MLACAYSGRTCRCGQARRLAAERRFAKRNTRTHAAIIVAPAPPPAYLDLPNPGVEGEWDPLVAHIQNGGNRVFCVRPTDGVLTSGNIAGTCPGFRIVGKPELKAVVRRTEWKGVLKEMKRIRDDVVLTSPLMREKRWWRKKGPTKIERSWVEEACEMFTTVAVDGGEKHKAATEGSGCFEVWKVDVEGVGDLVHDESWRGVGGDAEYVSTISSLGWERMLMGTRLIRSICGLHACLRVGPTMECGCSTIPMRNRSRICLRDGGTRHILMASRSRWSCRI
jgi:hypothetical protein